MVKSSTDTFNKEWNQTAVVHRTKVAPLRPVSCRALLMSPTEVSWYFVILLQPFLLRFEKRCYPLSLQRKFQRCWMHACYDALEVRHMFASNMFQNTTSKNVIFYVTFPYGHNARNPSNKIFCSDQVYFCLKTLLLSLKLVLRYFQGCWQSILYVKKCKLI